MIQVFPDHIVVDESLADETFHKDLPRLKMPKAPNDDFTDREKEVARLLALDHQTGEVAAKMGLSLARVKEHIADMNTKAKRKTRLAAVAWMIAEKIISLDE